MEEDIKILEEKIKEWEPYKNIDFPTETGKLIQKENQALENLIKEFKKIKIENIEYKMGQFPDTTETYKNLKKELEIWKNGEM